MVVFCEAVSTLNLFDLAHLKNFVSSIKPTENALPGAIRLYDLCSAFYEVADVYIKESGFLSQSQTDDSFPGLVAAGNGSQQLGGNGFVPEGGAFNQVVDLEGFNTWPTADWVLPDQYMMGGLFDPDFNL